ncbi:histone-lysine N-methyltransferase SUVR3-like [Pyrus ussuriensis x Pyrus communis]|uniref:Histone-lysine N-methyltransferase SUVR3-like n=1 Tax=Pyrus ussuriensis x Pyrus communis TaxID=2448454 RepID=A0A5N5FWS5_9ROSA|nr:histone-lysine N-methyltransferase SUVR3-like [Pyrus ussuriensis x Pyrus communis]
MAHLTPWLTPQELAIIFLTCTTLRAISTSITLRCASDISRSLEPHLILFHNSVDRHPDRTRLVKSMSKRCVGWVSRGKAQLGVIARRVGKRVVVVSVQSLVGLMASFRSVGWVVGVDWIMEIG